MKVEKRKRSLPYKKQLLLPEPRGMHMVEFIPVLALNPEWVCDARPELVVAFSAYVRDIAEPLPV